MENKEFEKLWVKATKRCRGKSHPEWGMAKEIAREMYDARQDKIYKMFDKILEMYKSGHETRNKEKIQKLQEWIYKNNTMPLKKIGMNIGTTDGGWNNTIELNKKIKEIFGL